MSTTPPAPEHASRTGAPRQAPDFTPIELPGLRSAGRPRSERSTSRVRFLALSLSAVLVLSLFARIMTYPLGHDEETYLPAAVLVSDWSIYHDLGFVHLPNFPLLLNAVLTLTGGDHLVLTGRVVIFLSWLLAGLAVVLIARHARAGWAMAGLGLVFLAADPIMQGQAGMMVTNNFVPVAFALFGLYFFLTGMDGAQPRPAHLLASGALLSAAIGFKANYIFLIPPFLVAALLAPGKLGLRRRWGSVLLPLLAGGVAGGLPSLYQLAIDPRTFLAHTTGYHTGPHVAYWSLATEPKVMGLGGKLLLAKSLWQGGTAMLMAIIVLSCAIVWRDLRKRTGPKVEFLSWQALLVAGLVAFGAALSFVPTPAFPQYFLLPVPFAVVLAIILYGQLDPVSRGRLWPTIIAAAIIAGATGLPPLLLDLTKIATPRQWTATRTERLAHEISARTGPGKVATLTPVYALEAGLDIYPELAAGPFVYRVADLMRPQDRRHYRLVSPATLSQLLDADPPAGILVGLEGDLDAAFVDYARSRGYAAVRLPDAETPYGTLLLYVRQGSERPKPAPGPAT